MPRDFVSTESLAAIIRWNTASIGCASASASALRFFFECLPHIERAATDERNFVKKGVSWALRGVGRRSHALHAAAVATAQRLAASPNATPRWVGKDALRDITRPAVKKRLEARRRAANG